MQSLSDLVDAERSDSVSIGQHYLYEPTIIFYSLGFIYRTRTPIGLGNKGATFQTHLPQWL